MAGTPLSQRYSVRASRAARTLALAVLAAFVVIGTPVSGQPGLTDLQVKAAYVFNFAHFVTWPGSSFDGPGAPFRVCIAGSPEIAPHLENIFLNETIASRPVRVQRDPPPADRRRCHIFYLSGSAATVQTMLKGLAAAPVLTVSDDARFIEWGGTLEFVQEGKRVRFDANLRGATAAGLTLSSQLLQVARRVQQ